MRSPLTKAAANSARRNRTSAVILEDITRAYLRTQRLSWAGEDVPLSEDNIDTLMTRLRDLPPATYGKQAEDKWDLLCLPHLPSEGSERSERYQAQQVRHHHCVAFLSDEGFMKSKVRGRVEASGGWTCLVRSGWLVFKRRMQPPPHE